MTAPDIDLDDTTITVLRQLVHSTTISRFAAEEAHTQHGLDGIYNLFAARICDNLTTLWLTGDWPDRGPHTGPEHAEDDT